MKICRFVGVLLVLFLLTAGLTACDDVLTLLFPEEESGYSESLPPSWEFATNFPAQTTAAPAEPNADMPAIMAEINSMSVADFAETDKTTEYIKITVKEGDNVLISKKKQKVAPGEMETLTLTKDMIAGIKAGEIRFSIE